MDLTYAHELRFSLADSCSAAYPNDDGEAVLKITSTSESGWPGSRPIRSSVGLHL